MKRLLLKLFKNQTGGNPMGRKNKKYAKNLHQQAHEKLVRMQACWTALPSTSPAKRWDITGLMSSRHRTFMECKNSLSPVHYIKRTAPVHFRKPGQPFRIKKTRSQSSGEFLPDCTSSISHQKTMRFSQKWNSVPSFLVHPRCRKGFEC